MIDSRTLLVCLTLITAILVDADAHPVTGGNYDNQDYTVMMAFDASAVKTTSKQKANRPPADIATNYAKLENAVKSRNIQTGPVGWECEGHVCNATTGASQLRRWHCEKLAINVGGITWLDIDGEGIHQSDLIHCNLLADTKREETIAVRLLDSNTERPIGDTEVEVHSDNGRRCVRAPCPTESQDWQGRTDAHGWVKIPSSVFNRVTFLQAQGYTGRQLMKDADRIESGVWEIALIRE